MKFNLKAYHGGLGDCLQFSTLPEMLTKAGHSVYLCKDAAYRHPAINDFVWGMNPYILGESAGEWNCGDTPSRGYGNRHNDFIMNWESLHGLNPVNSLPKIYYQPKALSGIDGIIELSALSLKYNRDAVIAITQDIIAKSNKNFKQLVSPNQSNNIIIPGIETITSSGLEETTDIIHNCKILVTLNSGVHALAAAVQRFGNVPDHHCFLPAKDYGWIMESKKFIFPNINYINES